MSKKMVVVCLCTFVIGCVGGGIFAYGNYQKGLVSKSLLASISQTQNDWEVEQFIREQEEQRPDGLEESQIATGSRYTGITYNNVSVATVTEKQNDMKQDTNQKEKTGLLQELFNNKNEKDSEDNEVENKQVVSNEKQKGRVIIQSGSLNVRAEGSIEGDVIGQAYKDELIEIVSQDGAWYQIITENGLQGYVSSKYVEFLEE